jgi:hypothetical protein
MSLDHSPARRGDVAGVSPATDAFMCQEATAELLGLSKRTLERFRLEGYGPPFRKFGRRVLYARSDVLSWADAQRRTSTSDKS